MVEDRLLVQRHDRRTRFGELPKVALGPVDHEVYVERELRVAANRLQHDESHRDVRHEVAIHHVDVDEINASRLGLPHLIGEIAEVGVQH